jgi:hypothetical protein
MFLRKKIFRNFIPFSSEEKDELREKLSEFCSLLEPDQDVAPEFMELKTFLETSIEPILEIAEDRNLVSFLMQKSEENFSILAADSVEKVRINSFLQANELFNSKAIIIQELRDKFFNGNLLIPALPSSSHIKYIANNDVAENVVLMMSCNEKSEYERAVQFGNRNRIKLQKLNNRTFKRTNIARYIKDTELPSNFSNLEEDQSLVDWESRLSEETLNLKGIGASEQVDAVGFVLDQGQRFLYLTPGARTIILDKEHRDVSFREIKAQEISPGDFICLHSDGKSNLIDEVATLAKGNYRQTRTVASMWKNELRELWVSNFNHDLNAFRDHLSEFGINRGSATLSNWMNDT